MNDFFHVFNYVIDCKNISHSSVNRAISIEKSEIYSSPPLMFSGHHDVIIES